jgi:DNA-binding LacI/PurR family transcriptional regulator
LRLTKLHQLGSQERQGEQHREHGTAAAAYALDRSPRPTAVLATTELLIGVLYALAAHAIRPGEDS